MTFCDYRIKLSLSDKLDRQNPKTKKQRKKINTIRKRKIKKKKKRYFHVQKRSWALFRTFKRLEKKRVKRRKSMPIHKKK
jgi:hypothetical protein